MMSRALTGGQVRNRYMSLLFGELTISSGLLAALKGLEQWKVDNLNLVKREVKCGYEWKKYSKADNGFGLYQFC
jgi:hypothetical protein